jgi:hypothetical protein
MTTYEITDSSGSVDVQDWDALVQQAQDWYDYMLDDQAHDDNDELQDVVQGARFGAVPEGDVEALQKAIDEWEDEIAAAMGHEAFHGHGSYGVSAACQAGLSLRVHAVEPE